MSATPQGTSEYFGRYPLKTPPITLGRTGFQVSPVGFGCYRLDEKFPAHSDALKQALLSGCNLIDTSSNYGNGASELLVGRVLGELFARNTLRREEVVIVTKAGYIQGDNLAFARLKAACGEPFPEVVEYAPDLWHCISPEFLADQITRSLTRLSIRQLDVFLLHNPEYFLKSGGLPLEYYRRIEHAFVHLETEARRGRIRYYGISSNTFPSPREDEDYTSLETILEIGARTGSRFAVIQFPFNLLEPGAVLERNNAGKSIARLAEESGLGTLVNRPLNAFHGDRMSRLADFPAHDGEDIVGNLKGPWARAMELEARYPKLAERAGLPLEEISFGHLLKRNFSRLSNLDTWNGPAGLRLRATLASPLEKLEREASLRQWTSEYRQTVQRLIDGFTAYLESQAAHESEKIAALLDHACPSLQGTKSLSRKALRVYRSFQGIDCVLLGMRRPEYVLDGLDLDPPLAEEDATRALEAVLGHYEPTVH